MARVVLIVDSATGALIDVAGNVREGGRYKKFVKRILSTDRNPKLDFGGNGGDSLEVSKNGAQGEEIKLHAKKVKVTGDLEVGGKALEDVVLEDAEPLLNRIQGVHDQVSVDESVDAHGNKIMLVGLDATVLSKLEQIDAALDSPSREEVAGVASGLNVQAEDGLQEVKNVLSALLDNIKALAPAGD